MPLENSPPPNPHPLTFLMVRPRKCWTGFGIIKLVPKSSVTFGDICPIQEYYQ